MQGGEMSSRYLYASGGIPGAAGAAKRIANLITADFKMVFLDSCIRSAICIQIACHIALSPRLAVQV